MPVASVLRSAAAEAPTGPGVYLFLDESDGVLYVGKAANLRRRLRQHAGMPPPTSHLHQRYELVRRVVWETAAREEAAAWREADLIFALRPPFNADPGPRSADPLNQAVQPPYIIVAAAGDMLSFTLQPVVPAIGRAYGCFPHLGKGVASRLGIACSDGYTALLRLLWAVAGEGTHMPTSITRSAPLSFTVGVTPGVREDLHRFLAGVSPRLADELWHGASHRPAYMQPALRRDTEAVLGFFAAGPQMVRSRRLRHGLRGRLLDAETYRRLVIGEMSEVITEGGLR